MINSELIYKKACALQKQCGTSDPFEISDASGIKIYYSDDLKKLLGMYICRWKQRIILLNGNTDENIRRIVLAHELGHDALHRKIASGGGLSEFTLFDIKDRTEYEANAFAAHILLSNDTVGSLAKEGLDVVEMSKILGTHVNLLLIKLQEMNRLGCDLGAPFPPDSDFLKKLGS